MSTVSFVRYEIPIAMAAYVDLMQKRAKANEAIVRDINARLKEECPEAADPDTQDLIESVWKAYRRALTERQITAIATRDLCEEAAIDFSRAKSLSTCLDIAHALPVKSLCAQAAEQNKKCGSLAKKILQLSR